jgi:hypothetical protein
MAHIHDQNGYDVIVTGLQNSCRERKIVGTTCGRAEKGAIQPN